MVDGHKIGKFWFSPTVPEEVLGSVKDLLIKNKYLIPSWTNEVRVYWDADTNIDESDDGNMASAYIETNYAYRFASLYICPAFLSEEPEDRETRLRHELCHIVSSPLVQYVRDVVTIVTKDETAGLLVTRESAEKIEAMTEDLAHIINEMEKSFTSKK